MKSEKEQMNNEPEILGVQPDLKLLLKPKEAAEALAIGARLLWTLTNCGDIPRIRIGKCVRYDPRDLVAWIDRQKKRGR